MPVHSPRINDVSRDVVRRNDSCVTAPFIVGGIYRRLDPITGLYETGTLYGSREEPNGTTTGSISRHRNADLQVTDGTAAFGEWELLAIPVVLDEPVRAEVSEQRQKVLDLALKTRAERLERATAGRGKGARG